MTLVVQHIYQE